MGQYKRPVVFDPRTNKFFIDEVIGNVRLINPGVTSIEGEDGEVTLEDINLDNVDNTSDADKPVSTAQQAALDAKANAIEWTITANGNSDYVFSGAGFTGTEADPVIYVVRGQTYKFTNAMGAHPFRIQSTQGTGGSAYDDGVTNNEVTNGTLTWEVRMDAPSTLYYQCTSHADMNGTIYVLNEGSAVASIDNLSDVDTSTVAPTDGQALVWDNANSKWEPGTVSGGGVSSVNTQTGAVSLGVEDLDDFALNLNTSTPIYSSVRKNNGQNVTNDGEYTEYVTSLYNRLLLNWDQADGSRSVKPTDNGTIWLSADGITYSALAIDGNVNEAIWSSGNRSYQVNFDATNWAIYTGLNIAIGGTLYWASSDPSGVPIALADGDLLRYESVSSKFRPTQLSVDNLSDVDTSTVAPTDGQALVWDNYAQKWGAVSLGVEDLDDYLGQPGTHPVAYHSDKYSNGDWGSSNSSTTGGYAFGNPSGGNYTGIYINKNYASSGTTLATQGFVGGTTLDLWVSADGVTFTQHTATNSYNQSSNNAQFAGLSPNLNAYTSASALYFSLSAPGAPAPLADGDILQYESTSSKFRPVQLGVDDLSDVDTSTVAPTDGQALVWDNANSQWEPGTISSGTTLPSGTTDGEALIWENGAWAVGPAIGGVDYFQGSTISSNYTAPTGFSYWVDTFSLVDPGSATLSNNNLTATCGGGITQAYSNSSKSSGLWYWEISVDGGTDNNAWFGMGVDVNYWVGSSNSGGIGINGSGQIANNTGGTAISSVSSHTSGDIRMFALDADNKKLWIGKNGTWENSGDPAAGTGEVLHSWTGTPDWLFICRLENTNSGWGNTIQITGSPGTQVTIPYSIDKLDDVDTSTVAPTDGQALVWDNANSQWEPGTVSAPVSSVNTLTGAVSLGVEDLDDFALQAASNQIAYHDTKTPGSYSYAENTQGGWLDESNFTGINLNRYYPTSGTSLGDQGFTAGSNVDFWISTDGVTYTQHTASSATVRSDNVVLFSNCSPDLTAYSSATAFYVSLTDPSTTPSTSLADGDILQYESSASKFRPKKIDSLGIDITDLDNVEKVVDSGNATWTYYSSNSSSPPSGQAGRSTSYGYGNVIFFNNTSSSGADYSTIFDNLSTKTISVYYDNVFAWKSTVTTNNNNGSRIGVKPIATYSGSFSQPADGTVIRIDFPDAGFFPLAEGDILQYESATSKFRPAQLPTTARAEVSGTTASIADAASADLTITNTGKAGQLLSIETDAAAWVTVYASQATRTADASRTETTDPATGSGVLAEAITTGAQTVLITPSTMFFNNEATPASELYLKVVNKSGAAAAITVTLKVIPLEV